MLCFVVASAGLLIWHWRPRRHDLVVLLRGPKSPSFVFGNMLELQAADEYGQKEYQWLEEFGAVYPIKGCLGQTRLMISDPEAMRFVLNSPNIGWASTQQKAAKMLLGYDSLLLARGQRHNYLRRIMNPWFSPRSVRSMLPIAKGALSDLSSHLNIHVFFSNNSLITGKQKLSSGGLTFPIPCILQQWIYSAKRFLNLKAAVLHALVERPDVVPAHSQLTLVYGVMESENRESVEVLAEVAARRLPASGIQLVVGRDVACCKMYANSDAVWV